MKNLHLIAYDISNNKKRNKIADILGEYGKRINLSVFECMITNSEKEQIIEQIQSYINPKKDSVRFYFICSVCFSKSVVLGRKEPITNYNVFV